MPRKKPKGIFCLEGDWTGDLKRPSSVRPVLELLTKLHPFPPYIYRGIGTRAEFEHYLDKWSQKRHSEFPILYLAFHGTPQGIHVGDQRRAERTVSLTSVADRIKGRCANRIIHFGACSTLKCDLRILKRFLKTTGALAVCGFTSDVGWVKSTAFEILVLDSLLRPSLTVHGARRARNEIERDSHGLARDLAFRMVIRESKVK